jgi:sugar-specific transcriptional regulator TrmB
LKTTYFPVILVTTIVVTTLEKIMTVVELLQQIGFNKYEAEAYATLLIHGPLTGYEVGKRSQVPLSRSYEILERLTAKGLVLVQPGDPPRYLAQDPLQVLKRVRATMEGTLNELAASLANLTLPHKADEFWVVRTRTHILEQVRTMIAQAQTSLQVAASIEELALIGEALAQASRRGCSVSQVPFQDRELQGSQVLLLCDERHALVGMLTPGDASQAVISSNYALLTALGGYFDRRRVREATLPAAAGSSIQQEHADWLAWEERKQRHLQQLSMKHDAA